MSVWIIKERNGAPVTPTADLQAEIKKELERQIEQLTPRQRLALARSVLGRAGRPRRLAEDAVAKREQPVERRLEALLARDCEPSKVAVEAEVSGRVRRLNGYDGSTPTTEADRVSLRSLVRADVLDLGSQELVPQSEHSDV
jgi:hypothetical protein